MGNDIETVLVLSPHTDDGEFGCGGAIAKMVEQGKKVYYVAFSTADESIPKGFPKNILEIEVRKATKILGIPEENLIVYKYPVRKLEYIRQEILEELVRIKKNINPQLVLIPSPNDLHQDHQTVAIEAMRAFKQIGILGYELPWNNIVFRTECFVPLEERHIDKKVEAVKAYESQMHRYYVNEDFIRGLAITRGTQIGVKLAEAFEIIRWIL